MTYIIPWTCFLVVLLFIVVVVSSDGRFTSMMDFYLFDTYRMIYVTKTPKYSRNVFLSLHVTITG